MKTEWRFTIQASDGRKLNPFLAEWKSRDVALQEATYMAEAHGVAMYVFSPYGIRIHTEPAPTLRPIGTADPNPFIGGGR